MERLGSVDFYEIISASDNIICEVGVFHSAKVNTKAEADNIAKILGGVAVFDRTAIIGE